MVELTVFDVLRGWEVGLTQPPVQRALTLLTLAYPDVEIDTLAELSIGQRDALLLQLREDLFGTRFTGIAACSGCGAPLELPLTTTDVRALPVDQALASRPPLVLDQDGYTVTFRLPNSQDLAAVTAPMANGLTAQAGADPDRLLMRYCLLAVSRDQIEMPVERAAAELPDSVIIAVSERMSEADPQADVELDLTCPVCGYHGSAAFDILAILWAEIHTWALRLLQDVHRIASAYGWREADILAMNPVRRQLYLEMIGP
ncbi:MAG TPA: hypothetical protein VMT24_12685 [Aggregatilineaceae bacterium]|nr:hypothetical protein [Aggregatilineaceae bacterium]